MRELWVQLVAQHGLNSVFNQDIIAIYHQAETSESNAVALGGLFSELKDLTGLIEGRLNAFFIIYIYT